MPDLLDEFAKEVRQRILSEASLEERLEGVPWEKRLEGIPIEKLLEALTPEARAELARRLAQETDSDNPTE